MRRAPVIAVVTALALASAPSFAVVNVQVQGQTVHIKAQNAPLSEVLQQVARQTGMKVVYDGPPPHRVVSFDLSMRSHREAIVGVLVGTGVSYALSMDASGRKVETLLLMTSTGSSRRPGGGGGQSPPISMPQPPEEEQPPPPEFNPENIPPPPDVPPQPPPPQQPHPGGQSSHPGLPPGAPGGLPPERTQAPSSIGFGGIVFPTPLQMPTPTPEPTPVPGQPQPEFEGDN